MTMQNYKKYRRQTNKLTIFNVWYGFGSGYAQILFFHLIFSSAEEHGCNHGSTYQSGDGIDG